MTAPLSGTILLVDDDPSVTEAFAGILSRHPGLLVLAANSAAQAIEAARIHNPDLVLSDLTMPDVDGRELANLLRSEPGLENIIFVIITGSQSAHADTANEAGIDDVMIKPIEAAELESKVRALLRLKRMHDELRADKLELERLHQAVERRSEQLLLLLVHIVDLSVPGSAVRAAETARLASRMAERFEIPAVLLHDFDVAARLHELGQLLVREDRSDDSGSEEVAEGGHWRRAVAARELCLQTEGLEQAGELIGAIYENWDGTGHPSRLRQGQIPLRSRILRILVDHQDYMRAPGATPLTALEELLHHGGTRYDPLALAYFEAIVRDASEEDWRESRTRVPVDALDVGMVLASDLSTSSGVKLLAKGATISAASLDLILRRHRSDPIPHGAWILRTPAG